MATRKAGEPADSKKAVAAKATPVSKGASGKAAAKASSATKAASGKAAGATKAASGKAAGATKAASAKSGTTAKSKTSAAKAADATKAKATAAKAADATKAKATAAKKAASAKTTTAKATTTKKAATAKKATDAKKATTAKASTAAATAAKAAKASAKGATTKKAAKDATEKAATATKSATAAKTVAVKKTAEDAAAKKPTASKVASKTAAAKTVAKTATEAAKAETAAASTEAADVKAAASATAASKKSASSKTATKSASKASNKKAAAAKTAAATTAKAAKAMEKDAMTKKAAVSKDVAAKAATPVEKVAEGVDAKEKATKAAASKKAAAKKAAAKSDSAKKPTEGEASKAQAPKEEAPASEAPKAEGAKTEPKIAAPKVERKEEAKAEAPKVEALKEEPTEEKAPVSQEPAEQPGEFADLPGVLIAAAECAPLVKVGGLADVVGALPKYLKKLGVDARVIMPLHRQIKERYFGEMQHLCDFQASLGWRSQYVGVEKAVLDGVTYYFIDNEFYFGGPIYCGGEFEGEQYAFFTRAVMDAIPQLDFDVQILHCNDWHTAMMPLLARTQYQGGMQQGLRTLLTIHNLFFQGQFSHEFDRDLLRVDDSLATPQFIEHYGCDNMLKAGIVFANKVNTVSPTYAREICEPYLGESLDGVLRSRGGDLWGILNGIDYDEWNPQTDENLPVRYTAETASRKMEVRDALLDELGLEPVGENTAVIGMVGRLTPQKGIDMVRDVLDELMGEDVRVIILGSGFSEYEGFLRDAEWRHKGRLCSYIGYAAELSHRIYAGSDLFLMPSKFEPCGISQMISMRYGTLPIVRETGGLKDTVVPYNEYTGEGNGFSFANYNAYEMLGCIRYALNTWRNEDARKSLIQQAMASDFSFDRCARSYAELYRAL